MPVTGRGPVCMDTLQCKQQQPQTQTQLSTTYMFWRKTASKILPSSPECTRIHQAMWLFLSQTLWQELSHVTDEDLQTRHRGAVCEHVYHMWKQTGLGTHLNR